MKKATLLAITSLFLLPLVASAAWWNPFSWKKAPPAPALVPVSVLVESTSTVDTSLMPSTDDLYKRIAELELKLDDARTKIKEMEAAAQAKAKVAAAPAAPTPAASSGLPASDIMSKVKPAIVLVETASSSAAASIIDAQGHILTSAHVVWIKNSHANVIGAFPEATITLSTGAKTKATLVGIEEAADLAILQLSDKRSSAFIPLNYGSTAAVGDKVYVFGFPSTQANGSAFTSGVIAQKTSAAVQATIDDKPFDNGGAMVTNKGALIGIPEPSTCKVLEEMSTCLKYTVAANIFPSRVPKLLAGMKLFRNKQDKTPEEKLVRGILDGVYGNINQSDAISFAVSNVTGKNSFDYLNGKLGSDIDDKIAKVYVIKLKAGAQNIDLAFEFLKDIAYALRLSLINEESSIVKLDAYQQKIIRTIQAENDVRLKDYQGKVDLWSKKKNEYDSYLLKPSDATHDYFMAEGVSVEAAAEYLGKERQKILDSLSSDAVNIF